MVPQNTSPPKDHDKSMETLVTTIIAIAFIVVIVGGDLCEQDREQKKVLLALSISRYIRGVNWLRRFS